MVRPREDAPGPKARERLVSAFWSMLSEMDYSAMTMAGLSRRAGVNHNTFYRYHKSLDGMTASLVSDSAARGMAYAVISVFCCLPSSDAVPPAFGDSDAENALTVARNGSRALVDLMCSSAIERWLEGEWAAPGSVSDVDADGLSAIFWGVAAVSGRIPAGDLGALAMACLAHAFYMPYG